MFYQTMINQMSSFIEKLQDEESRELYDARLEFFFSGNEDKMQERICSCAQKYSDTFYCWGLDTYYYRNPLNKDKPFIVFGAGNMGKQTIRTLELLNKNIVCVVDNSPELWGESVCGHTIEKPDSIREKDCVIVVAVRRLLQINIYYQLLGLGVRENMIIMHQEGGLFLDYGKQYFDVEQVLPNEKGEIFVDAGCYDGMSSVNASRWANGGLKKVYAFEPDRNSLAICEKNIRSIGCDYEIHNIATWDKKEVLNFDVHENAGYGSKVIEGGGVCVDADSIDNVLNGESATYIKLDVEGSELRTLRGAINTIKRWRPKLAISIYHKPEDIIEIPAFVEELDMGYKYYIRQYQTRIFETTLYAI